MAGMSLASIRIDDDQDCPESLAWALHAICRWAGTEVPYDTLCALLGLSFLTTSTGRRDDSLAVWPAYGRDVLLAEAAERLGLRLRAAHPPDAARGLDHAPEFAQHFEASYQPIVRRALENDQPVLAWQGWPGARRLMWGVITELAEGGIGLAGTTSRSGRKPVSLVEPPVQLYVVEAAVRQVPDEGQWLGWATEAAHRVLCETPDRHWGIVIGPGAYDLWADRLEKHSVCPSSPREAAWCHTLVAQTVVAARTTAVAFFSRCRESAAPGLRPTVDAVISHTRALLTALTSACDRVRADELLEKASGRETLAAEIRAAMDLEQPIRSAIGELRDLLRQQRPAAS